MECILEYTDINERLLIYLLLKSDILSLKVHIVDIKKICSRYKVISFACSHLVYLGGYYARWFIPLIVIFAYDLSKLKFFDKKVFLFYFIIFIYLINFNSKNFSFRFRNFRNGKFF